MGKGHNSLELMQERSGYMPQNLISKHLWEGIFIGIVSAMIVVAFFMPYYTMHYQISKDINQVLLAFNPSENSIKEVRFYENDLRLVLFEDVRDLSGTIFSPTLLFGNTGHQEDEMFYSSFDYLMQTNSLPGDIVEILGFSGLYAGFYPNEHPYGDNFLVIISPKVSELKFNGIVGEFGMTEDYKTHLLPRGFRGVKLFYFLIFAGLLYFTYGVTGILVDNQINYFIENTIRLLIVSITIVASITIYGLIINPSNLNIILWSCGIAIFANVFMIPPLFCLWLGKKIYKKV